MTFTEDWFSDHSQFALHNLYRKVEHLTGDIVEIGCWEGRSTIALANACHPEILHAVDTWEGSPGEISRDLAAQRDVYATFTANIAELTNGNIDPNRMDWRAYLAANRRPIKFVHIDATHSYEEVRDNILELLPLMVPGGIICGDDQHHLPVREAVWDTLGNAWLQASLWWKQLPEGR